MPRRRSVEDRIQRALVQHLRLRAVPGVFWYAYLEVKSMTGRATEHQLQAIADINRAGGFAPIGHGIDSCLAILQQRVLVKGA
jgi:hypothetical protein